MIRPKSVSRNAGFSLIELLVVLLVGLMLMLVAAPELFKYYIRSRLEGVTRETSFVLQKARYQAIKYSQPEQVCGDSAARKITGLGQTIKLPDSVNLYEVTVLDNCFVFRSDGSVQDTGEFRFSDVRGNLLEVQVKPQATARVQVRKWDEIDNQWYRRDQGGKAWTWKTGNIF